MYCKVIPIKPKSQQADRKRLKRYQERVQSFLKADNQLPSVINESTCPSEEGGLNKMSYPVNVERYLELTKIEEIASEMINKGYNISKDHKISNLSYDLLAEKNGEKIFIEVKSGKALQNHRDRIKQMASTAKKIENAVFKLVVVNPPRTKSIEIENIENILYECFIEKLPSELDQLSTHTLVSGLSNVEITDVSIR